MNFVKSNLTGLIVMFVTLCPHIVMAEPDAEPSFGYVKKERVVITDDGKPYMIDLYSFDSPALRTYIKSRPTNDESPYSVPHKFLIARQEGKWLWWFAVKYKLKETILCSYMDEAKGYTVMTEQIKDSELKFLTNLNLGEYGKTKRPDDNPLEKSSEIIRQLENRLDVKKISDVWPVSVAENRGFKSKKEVVKALFEDCSEFLDLSTLQGELSRLASEESENAGTAPSITTDAYQIQNVLQEVRTQFKITQDSLKIVNSTLRKINDQLEETKQDQAKDLEGLLKWFKWLCAFIVLLMTVIVIAGFLLYRKLAKMNTDSNRTSIDESLNERFGEGKNLKVVVKDALNEHEKQQNTSASSVDKDESGGQSSEITKKLKDLLDGQIKNSIQYGEKYDQEVKNYEYTLEYKYKLKDRNNTYKRCCANLRSLYKDTSKPMDTRQMIESLGHYSDSAHDLILKLLDAFKSEHEEQAEKKKRYQDLENQIKELKKTNVQIYQQGGLLKPGDGENEQLEAGVLAELVNLYSKRPMVQQYALAINSLKESLNNSASTDEPFFKAIGLDVLLKKLNGIDDFRIFYEADDESNELSKSLIGHWKDYIQRIFCACLLLKSYFQLDPRDRPILLDLELARSAAAKLLEEHGLSPDYFELPVAGDKVEHKFDISVHGEIPADLVEHDGFRDKVDALRDSGVHKVVCYVDKWGLNSQKKELKDDLTMLKTTLKYLESLDKQNWRR